MHRVGTKALQDRGLLTPKAVEVFIIHLGYSSVVASPAKHRVSKSFYLSSPPFVILFNRLWADQENVDVTLQSAIPPRRRPKHRYVNWLKAPSADRLSHVIEKCKTEARELGEWRRCDIIPIQRVDLGPSQLFPERQDHGRLGDLD